MKARIFSLIGRDPEIDTSSGRTNILKILWYSSFAILALLCTPHTGLAHHACEFRDTDTVSNDHYDRGVWHFGAMADWDKLYRGEVPAQNPPYDYPVEVWDITVPDGTAIDVREWADAADHPASVVGVLPTVACGYRMFPVVWVTSQWSGSTSNTWHTSGVALGNLHHDSYVKSTFYPDPPQMTVNRAQADTWYFYFRAREPGHWGENSSNVLDSRKSVGVLAVHVAGAYPKLTLQDSTVMYTGVGETFSDPGATAMDYDGSTLPVTVSDNLDLQVPGDYELTYSATSVGYSTTGQQTSTTNTVTRTVRVAVIPVVPNVVGETVADGVAMIQAAGYSPLRADFADTQDPSLVGTIHSTTPAAGEALARGGTVYYLEYR